VQRGDMYRFKVPKGIGREQRGERFGVVVQADAMLPRSVVLVAPTSRSARPASFRPEVVVAGDSPRVLVEQLGAVDVRRFGFDQRPHSDLRRRASQAARLPC